MCTPYCSKDTSETNYISFVEINVLGNCVPWTAVYFFPTWSGNYYALISCKLWWTINILVKCLVLIKRKKNLVTKNFFPEPYNFAETWFDLINCPPNISFKKKKNYKQYLTKYGVFVNSNQIVIFN